MLGAQYLGDRARVHPLQRLESAAAPAADRSMTLPAFSAPAPPPARCAHSRRYPHRTMSPVRRWRQSWRALPRPPRVRRRTAVPSRPRRAARPSRPGDATPVRPPARRALATDRSPIDAGAAAWRRSLLPDPGLHDLRDALRDPVTPYCAPAPPVARRRAAGRTRAVAQRRGALPAAVGIWRREILDQRPQYPERKCDQDQRPEYQPRAIVRTPGRCHSGTACGATSRSAAGTAR